MKSRLKTSATWSNPTTQSGLLPKREMTALNLLAGVPSPISGNQSYLVEEQDATRRSGRRAAHPSALTRREGGEAPGCRRCASCGLSLTLGTKSGTRHSRRQCLASEFLKTLHRVACNTASWGVRGTQ